jgi:hypothetical protein
MARGALSTPRQHFPPRCTRRAWSRTARQMECAGSDRAARLALHRGGRARYGRAQIEASAEASLIGRPWQALFSIASSLDSMCALHKGPECVEHAMGRVLRESALEMLPLRHSYLAFPISANTRGVNHHLRRLHSNSVRYKNSTVHGSCTRFTASYTVESASECCPIQAANLVVIPRSKRLAVDE